MRNLIRKSIVFLLYMVFIVTGCICLRQHLRYVGIDSWPSVNAEIVGSGGGMHTIPTHGRYGMSSTTIDSQFVEFQYSVGGKVYTTKVSEGLPPRAIGEPWRAYYKPSSPDIALLSRSPHRSAGLIVVATFSGIFVLVHAWCGVSDRLKCR
jgi:hypothetical protein